MTDSTTAHPVTPQVQALAAWSWRLLVIAAAGYVTLRLMLRLELLFIVLFVALAVTALLLPLRRLVERTGIGRAGATAVSLLLGLIGLALVFSLLGQSLVNQWGDISDSFVEGVDKGRNWLRTGPLHITDQRLSDYVDQANAAISKNRDTLLSGVAGATATAAEVASGAFLALFTTIFFLYDGERIWRWLANLLPRSAQASASEAAALGWSALTGYVRGTVIIAFVDAATIGLGIWIAGVPLALPLAVLVFFGAFIPIVGATVTGVIAVAIALATKGVLTAAVVLAIILAVQQIEGHVLQPVIMGRMVNVHPLGVVLTVTAGSLVAGILGAIVAVPVVAVATAVIGYYGRRSRARHDELLAHARSPERPPLPGTVERAVGQHAEQDAERAAALEGTQEVQDRSADHGVADDPDRVPTTG